jgi:hypothetical protein
MMFIKKQTLLQKFLQRRAKLDFQDSFSVRLASKVSVNPQFTEAV